MTTNKKDYIIEDNEELRKVFGDTMEGQFEHDLYNKLSVISLNPTKRKIYNKEMMVDGGC